MNHPHRAAAIAVLALTLSAITPISLGALATSVRMETDLSGAEQVREAKIPGTGPDAVTLPIGPLVTGGYGEAMFTLSPDRTTLYYKLEASHTGTPIFMAHIHLGPMGANGPVMLWLFADTAFGAFPRSDGAFTGSISGMLTAADLKAQPGLGVVTFEDAVANILRGNAYVNVHTVANPPGEIRGQLGEHEKHHHFPFGLLK